MAGSNNWGEPVRAFKMMELQGAPKATESQKLNKDIGKGRSVFSFTNDYYVNAGKALGVTAKQAKQASDAGGRSGSGKKRDAVLRRFQDLNDGGNRVSQYSQNRASAKLTTAGFSQKAKLKAQPKTNEAILRSTSSDPDIAKANAKQTAYVASLRAGGVGIAEALLNPQTSQTYFKNNIPVSKSETSINAEKFFEERGYDLSKPELIPDSIFKPEKQLDARTQSEKAVMGDLNKKANTYSKTTPEVLEKRNKIREDFGYSMIPNIKASAPLEFFGPTNKKGIENFKLIDFTKRPVTLTGMGSSYGLNTLTGNTQRLKTVGETTSPEMQFFGQFVQGSRNTFDSYGNLLTNLGNTVTGKPQQPMSRPPVQDQFFGAVIDSGKNTFYGKQDRSADPLGDFFNVQQKRIDRVGYGQVAGELTTEALFWTLPVGAIGKVAKGGLGFFSNTVKTTKASKTFTPGADFIKFEGKTKSVGLGDQLGAFFGPKGSKTKAPKPQPFLSSTIPLGKGTTKAKGKKGGNDFFGGSKSTKSKKSKSKDDDITKNFLGKEIQGGGSNQFLIQRTKQITKTKTKTVKPVFKSYPIQLGKTVSKVKTKTKVKQKQVQKQKQIQKQTQKQSQQFFKPIPLVTPKVKQKQVLKQNQKQIFKPIPKVITKITPKIKQKQKLQQVGVIAPYFPQSSKSSFLFPIPRPRRGGVGGSRGRGKRYGKRSFTAWNVNPNQVGGFLKGPTYKKSRSDFIFKDLDKRTKKEKPKKDYDYLDFF